MDKSNRPIGVFDSGLGGLTVVKEIIKLLPNEDIIYLGDTARVPYGTRGNEIIKKFSVEDIEFLLKYDVKCVVIACHTVSSVAGDYLKKKFSKTPIFDVVSPVIENLRTTKEKIGVIGTRATITSNVYSKLNNVIQVSCPLFVPFIEEGEIKGELIEKLTRKYLDKLNVDTLVLGCTHYPIISEVIKKFLPEVKQINPGVLVTKKLKNFLTESNLLNSRKDGAKRSFYVTDLNERFVEVANQFLGEERTPQIKFVEI